MEATSALSSKAVISDQEFWTCVCVQKLITRLLKLLDGGCGRLEPPTASLPKAGPPAFKFKVKIVGDLLDLKSNKSMS